MPEAERDKKGKLNGRWRGNATFTHPNGSETRWRKRGFRTREEAEGAEAYFRATGQVAPHLAAAPTHSFTAVAERFKQKHPEWLAAHDGRTNAARLEAAVECLGKLDIKEVRFAQLEDFIDYLRKRSGRYEKRPSNRTLRRYVDAAFKVLRYANKLDLILGLPERPEIENTGKVRKALTADQERTIVANMEVRGRHAEASVVRLLLATGMRAGEFHAVTAEMIELPVEREQTGVMLTADITKTKQHRWVPIIPELARLWRSLLTTRRMPNAAQVYNAFKKSVRRVGHSSDLTIHCLRHTTTTRLLATGAQWLTVAEIIGHQTGKTTSIYYHPEKAALFSVVEKVQQEVGQSRRKAAIVPLRRYEGSEQICKSKQMVGGRGGI